MDTRSLSEAIELHSLECRINNLTQVSIHTYQVRLKSFLAFVGDLPLNAITPLHVKEYRLHLIGKGLSAQTQKGLLSALRAFFNFCVNDPDILLAASPMKAQKMPRVPDKILPSVNDTDFEKAVRNCGNVRDKALLLLMASSGLRAAEVAALNIFDADLKTGTVIVKQGKMQKDRIVYIDPATCKALRIYLSSRKNMKPSSPLIGSNHKNNARLLPHGVSQIMADIRERTKAGYLTAHGLRRRFTTKAIGSGMNIHIVAKLLGHSDITMLRQYLDLQELDTQDAYQRIFG